MLSQLQSQLQNQLQGLNLMGQWPSQWLKPEQTSQSHPDAKNAIWQRDSSANGARRRRPRMRSRRVLMTAEEMWNWRREGDV